MNKETTSREVLSKEAFFSIVNGEIFIWDAFQEALQAESMPVGVGRFIPLHFLVDGPLRLQELTERTHAKESATSRLVERMVKDGLIEKRRDGSDGRAVLLCITEEGQHVEARGRAAFAQCLAGLFDGFSDSELEMLVSLIARIGAAANAAAAVEEAVA